MAFSKLKSESIWSFSLNASQVVLRIFFIGILARYISPSSFGIYALFFTIIEILRVFVEQAFNKRVILTNKNITTEVFTSSMLFSVGIVILSLIIIPFLPEELVSLELQEVFFYGLPVMFLISINATLSNVAEKEIDFKYLTSTRTISTLIGTNLVSVLLAVQGFEYWSLLYGFYVSEVLFLIILAKKYFRFFNKLHSNHFKEVFKEYFTITGIQFVNKLALKVDYLIASHFLGSDGLGYYSKAYQIMNLPSTLIGNIISKIGFSGLNKYKIDTESLKQTILRLFAIISVIMIPMSFIAYAFKDFIITLVLGDQWAPSISVFGILVLALFFRIGYKIPNTFLQFLQKFRLILRIQIVYLLLICSGGLLGVSYGLDGLAYGVFLALLINFTITTVITLKILNVRMKNFFKSILPGIWITFILVEFDLLITSQFDYRYIIVVGALLLVHTYLFKKIVFNKYITWWLKKINIIK